MNQTSPTVLALDVGGTSIKGTVVTGELSAPASRNLVYSQWPTPRAEGPAAVVATVVRAAEHLLAQTRAAGDQGAEYRGAGDSSAVIGLVVPGIVDEPAGIAVYSENLGWHDVPLRQLIAERTGLPVVFGHDVRAGGLAEWTLGAGRGSADLLFLPIGTGISGAMFVGGRPVTNAFAGEIGHIDVGWDIDCACGGRGCLEAVASAAAIARRYRGAGGSPVDGARQVLDQLADGDQIAQQVWDGAINALARALASYVCLLAPERIVVGGGLVNAGDLLFQPLAERLSQLLVLQPMPELVPAAFSDHAGCLGAALLALESSWVNARSSAAGTG